MALARVHQVRARHLLTAIEAVRTLGTPTTAQVIEHTGLSRPSVISLLEELEELGWVAVEDPVPDGSGGRPPQRFRFRVEAGRLVGVDVGLHRVTAVLTDLAGAVIASDEAAVAPEALPPERLAALDSVVARLLDQAGLDATAVWAAAVALTGPVTPTGATLPGGPLPGWGSVDLVAHVRARFGWTVQVVNDVMSALLAESTWGAAQGSQDVVFVLASVRTGAAALVSGRLLRGHAGIAGEIGALPDVHWLRALEDLTGQDDDISLQEQQELIRAVFDAARAGDTQAQERVEAYARDVATGAAALTLTTDPEVLVVGGGQARWADQWVDAFSARVRANVIRMPQVRVSTLGGDHVARGAVRLALDEVEKTYFSTTVLAVPAQGFR
ncbi:ROK family protein [Isoptericola sp. NPDC055881]